MSSKDSDLEMVKRAVESLGEHFDTVHIFTTRHDPESEGGTVNISWSAGNWFARYGQISEWLIKSNERSKKFVREQEND